MLFRSVLSFLGLGVQEPNTSWGVLVQEGQKVMESQPWMLLVPLRLIEGTAWSASQVASMAMMGDLLAGDARRPRLVSAYRMSGSLAFSVAIVVSGTVAQGVGYAGSFLVAAATFVAGFVVIDPVSP